MILIIATIIFLFVFFIFAKEDFILLRKNVSLTTIFDVAILSGLIGLITSRIGYVALHYSSHFLNPLVFFIIPYFPGLSSGGFLLGSIVSLYFFAISKKIPMGRVYDIFSFALTFSVGVFFLTTSIFLLVEKSYVLGEEYGALAVILFFIGFFTRYLFLKSSWRDGSLFFMNSTVVILFLFFSSAIPLLKKSVSNEWPYFLALLFLLFTSFLVRLFKRSGERA